MKALWRYVHRRETSHLVKLVASFVISLFVLEILVNSFTNRQLYTWIFVIVGVDTSVYLLYPMSWKSGIPIFVWLVCWFLSIFTLMPAEIPYNTKLVVLSGLMIVIIGGVTRYLHLYAGDSKYWPGMTHGMKKSKFSFLFLLQIASFKAPGRYYLKPGVTENFKKTSSESGRWRHTSNH